MHSSAYALPPYIQVVPSVYILANHGRKSALSDHSVKPPLLTIMHYGTILDVH